MSVKCNYELENCKFCAKQPSVVVSITCPCQLVRSFSYLSILPFSHHIVLSVFPFLHIHRYMQPFPSQLHQQHHLCVGNYDHNSTSTTIILPSTSSSSSRSSNDIIIVVDVLAYITLKTISGLNCCALDFCDAEICFANQNVFHALCTIRKLAFFDSVN